MGVCVIYGVFVELFVDEEELWGEDSIWGYGFCCGEVFGGFLWWVGVMCGGDCVVGRVG